MKGFKRMIYFFILILLEQGLMSSVFAQTSIINNDPNDNFSTKSVNIGVILPSLQDPVSLTILAGISEEAKLYQYNLLIADCDNQVQKQARELKLLLNKHLNALIIDPIDPSTLTPVIEQNDINIPIVSVNGKFSEIPIVYSHVGNSSVDFIQKVVNFGKAQFPKKDKIYFLQMNVTSKKNDASIDKAKKGIKFVEGKNDKYHFSYKNIILRNSQISHKQLIQLSFNTTLALFTQTPHPDVIFTNNGYVALGIVQACKKQKYPSQVLTTSTINDVLYKMPTNPMLNILSHNYLQQGRVSLKTCQLLLNGHIVNSYYLIPTTVLTAKDIPEYEKQFPKDWNIKSFTYSF